MKKLLLGIGSVLTVAVPVVTVVACGSESESVTAEVKLTSSSSLLSSQVISRDIEETITVTDFESVIEENKEKVLELSELAKANDKVRVVIEYQDASIEVDIQVKHTGNGKLKIIVNKVYLKPISGVEIDESLIKGTKISDFKDYTRKFVYALVKLEGTTESIETILEEVKDHIANPTDLT